MPTDESRVERSPGGSDLPAAPPTATADPSDPDLPLCRKAEIPYALLDENALTVVRRLQRFGHEAYLVGGCVRDLLAGLEPKDFDVATDARPSRIKRIFRNARIIGRRFRLAHIRFGPDHIVETSTFRAEPNPDAPSAPAPAPRRDDRRDDRRGGRRGGRRDRHDRNDSPENIFGTAPEDARRRDFTINALFYDPSSDEVIDWTGGLADLDAGVVRSIGNPAARIREDPVRMIRAVHFAMRMGFRVEPDLDRAISTLSAELARVSPARLYVELLKVLQRGRARPTLHRLHERGVLQHWLPELAPLLGPAAMWPEQPDVGLSEADPPDPPPDAPPDAPPDPPPDAPPDAVEAPVGHSIWMLLGAADRWGMAAHDADDALVLAPLLGPWILHAWRAAGFRPSHFAFQEVFEEHVRPLARRMSVPRRTQAHLRDALWILLEIQHLPRGKRAARLARRPGFRTALDLLRLDLMGQDRGLELLQAWEDLAPPRRRGSYDDRRPSGQKRRSRRRGRRGQRGPERAGPLPAEEAAAWTPAPPLPEAAPPPPEADPPLPEADPPPPEADPPLPEADPPPQPERPRPPPAKDDFAEGIFDT